MSEIQELIKRGRLLLSNSPKRRDLFKLTNGKNSTKEISSKVNRSLSSVNQDYEKLRDMELVRERKNGNGDLVKKDSATVYEKVPLIKHISSSMFEPETKTKILDKKIEKSKKTKQTRTIRIPSEREILDIGSKGENQLFEFKEAGVETEKITREIAALLHTKNGGIVFYGMDDDGNITGSNITRQKMDEKIQNSLQNTLSSHPEIKIKEKKVLGMKILLIVVPPWDKKTLYQYRDGKYYIRKGTTVFPLKPDEMKKLSNGKYLY